MGWAGGFWVWLEFGVGLTTKVLAYLLSYSEPAYILQKEIIMNFSVGGTYDYGTLKVA